MIFREVSAGKAYIRFVASFLVSILAGTLAIVVATSVPVLFVDLPYDYGQGAGVLIAMAIASWLLQFPVLAISFVPVSLYYLRKRWFGFAPAMKLTAVMVTVPCLMILWRVFPDMTRSGTDVNLMGLFVEMFFVVFLGFGNVPILGFTFWWLMQESKETDHPGPSKNVDVWRALLIALALLGLWIAVIAMMIIGSW